MSGVWGSWGILPDWGQILYSAVRPEQYGAGGQGQTDDTAALVAARAAALSAGAVCWCEGVYNVGSTQVLQANEWLHLPVRGVSGGPQGSRIIGNFSGSRLIQTAGFGSATKANDVRITGPGRIGRQSIGQSGDILGIWGDRFIMQETTIDTFSQGRAFYGGGDRHWVWRVNAQNNDGLTGTGGWRFAAGNYSRMVGLNIQSGDDCLQFTPAGATSDPLWNVGDTTHCFYEHCIGQSAAARFMVALFQASGAGLGQMSTNILHSGFTDCHGIGNARGLFVTNRDSYGMIYGLVFRGCGIDLTGAQTTFGEDAYIFEDPSSSGSFTGHVLGPLRGTVLDDLSITNSAANLAPLRVIGATESTEISRPRFQMQSNAATALIELTGGNGFHVVGGLLDMQNVAKPCILGGAGGTLSADIQIDRTRVIGLASSQIAFNMNAVTTPKISRTKTEIATGATAVVGARTGATTTNARIRDNDWAATPTLTDLGTGTQHTGNVGLAD